MLFESFDLWLIHKAMSQKAQTNPPKRPSSLALQHLLDDQLLQQAWETAAIVALHYTVNRPEPALQGLTVALEGVRRGHYFGFSRELPTVCQGQYADGRPCTASAKKHGQCLRHQKQANAPPSVESVLGRLYEQVSQGPSRLSKSIHAAAADAAAGFVAVGTAAGVVAAADGAFGAHSIISSANDSFKAYNMFKASVSVCVCLLQNPCSTLPQKTAIEGSAAKLFRDTWTHSARSWQSQRQLTIQWLQKLPLCYSCILRSHLPVQHLC